LTAVSGPSSGDLLGAASLLLAILGALLGVWYGEMASAIAVSVPQKLADADAERGQVKTALFGRALPLLLAAVLLSAVFIPEAVHILIKFGRRAINAGVWTAITTYDPVSISLVLVPIAMAGFAFFLLALTKKLTDKRKKLALK
jgi:hypothetical protein